MEDSPRLYPEVVSSAVLSQLRQLMQIPSLDSFRLAGGTALALQRGHRVSVDLDLFAERSFLPSALVLSVTEAFSELSIDQMQSHGLSAHWQATKIDLYYMGTFLYPPLQKEGIRLTDIRDIAAMKLECILSRKERKDYYDIAELLQEAPLNFWMAEFQKKYPYYQVRTVVDHLLNVSEADTSLVPQMLDSTSWDQVKEQIQASVRSFLLATKRREKQAAEQREAQVNSLLARRRKKK